MSVRLLETAEAKLDDAISWYAQQAPGLGDAWLAEALRAFDLIQHYPDAWDPLTASARRCRLRQFPYGVIYTRIDDDILILAIAHLHHRPGYWQDRLKERHP